MKQKLIDYVLNMPRHIVWRGIFILSITFWLLVIFSIAFLIKCGQKSRDFLTALFTGFYYA